MFVYYDSKTGNVQRFIDKIKKERPEWSFVKISGDMEISENGHLVTFTTNFGEIPNTTEKFLENKNNRKYIESVCSSGNMNWGTLFGKAADKIEETYSIPVLMKFELSGTHVQVEYFINSVENK
ncbi:class Ib ribonucleoside-diphosphate reductase assembly flavoprotein NrdI [Leptotrichia sp. oral taxon 212]|jgi:nrdI protein|uniref:class Ib ribonucleoside-diphosphate reductase assembly flavoprotein NrdI n=1 Tax=Leptotrichia sp. oral taxon 212 TaxID=712357 RepID=UPI0006A9574E|nr:class Ib ribonucleoside-diphosphate reductase assembly flavoprotein NrdI [Leptotrichia sp. oral taxon 212]ALA95691.1 ribonucleotide reductase [Leptotrichia sp. oral taxon 212]